MVEERGRMFDRLIELIYGIGGYLCSVLERFGVYEERGENESFVAQVKDNRGRFPRVCFGTRFCHQILVPGHSNQMPVPAMQ